MKPPLLIALALVLGATLYLSSQPDDSVEPVRAAGRPAPASGQVEAGEARPPTTMPDPTPARSQAGDSWAHQALVQAVGQWRQRTVVGLPTGAAGQRSTWGSMQPPPPPPPAYTPPPPPPPPMAPPFPHRWVGRLLDEASEPGGKALPVARAVLAGPVSTWVVKAGDVIEGTWRVDQIQERRMRLTYLPLQQQQSVEMR